MILGKIALGIIFGGLFYRLRGGLFSNLMRRAGWDWLIGRSRWYLFAFWALPSGILCWELTDAPEWAWPALIVSFFCSVAFYGHGAHMVFDNKQFLAFSTEKTELLTEFWLPELFNGIPNPSWPDFRVTLYNLLGMSFIGFIRNFTAAIPLFWLNYEGALIYGFTGLLHGPLYWLGWKIRDGETSEVIVGAVSWGTLILVLS